MVCKITNVVNFIFSGFFMFMTSGCTKLEELCVLSRSNGYQVSLVNYPYSSEFDLTRSYVPEEVRWRALLSYKPIQKYSFVFS